MIPTLCLVCECRELEEHFGTNYTDAILEICRETAHLSVEVVNKLKEGVGPNCGILHYIWVQGIQMGSSPSQGCWHITVMDQSRVLCVMRTTLIPTLFRVHQHESGLNRTPVDSVDQLVINR